MDKEDRRSETDKIHTDLECPFTWDIDQERAKAIKKNRKLTKDEDANTRDFKCTTEFAPAEDIKCDAIPLMSLMNFVTEIYAETINNECSAVENINKMDKWLKTYITTIEDNEISVEAIKHIVEASKYFVLLHFNNELEANEILRGIEIPKEMNNIYKSTLSGFRAMVWFIITNNGSSIRCDTYIRQALDENPRCGLWHFILGLNSRRDRIDKSDMEIPNAEERMAFIQAYELSPKTIKFAVFAAQMYRESRQECKALEIFKTFVEDGEFPVLQHRTYLRFALGFIRGNELPLAKKCLDIVEATNSSRSMYYHYRGLYHKKMRQYEEAAKYFHEAVNASNLVALEDYCFCMLQIGPFDTLEYLLSILDLVLNEYKSHNRKAKILFHIALEYYSKRNMPKVLQYFHQGAMINPENLLLRIFITIDKEQKHVNIYETLTKAVFRTVEMRRKTLDDRSIELYSDLRSICDNLHKQAFDINKGVKDIEI